MLELHGNGLMQGTRNQPLVAAAGLITAVCAGSVSAQTAEMRLVEELRLGQIEGSGPDVFADIHDLAVDPEGRIYVVDVGWKEVRLFDRDGRFVRRLGREGGGPGERSYLNIGSTRVTWDAHRDRLWIDDGLHRLVLDSVGAEYARATRAPSFLPPNAGAHWHGRRSRYAGPPVPVPLGAVAQPGLHVPIHGARCSRLGVCDRTGRYAADRGSRGH